MQRGRCEQEAQQHRAKVLGAKTKLQRGLVEQNGVRLIDHLSAGKVGK